MVDALSLSDPQYRINSLYQIIDRNGDTIPFRLNAVQNDVLNNLHTRNVILKARQLGMSTFAVLYLLDACIWTDNLSAGIVSYSLEHAQHIFKRIIGHALDHLPTWLNVPIINRSAREITFGNGSVLRVDTTLRGGAYQLVLVSEYGKTCARNPQKAEEVITGTLQAVPKDGKVIIESTGEGTDGFFANMVMDSARRGNENLTSLDYKLFFYPWMQEPSYAISDPVKWDVNLTDYFTKIEAETGVIISKEQKQWYAIQQRVLGDKLKQEYPSTVSEAFASTSEAYYFAESISKAYDDNRCLTTPLYDALLPVYVAMDIGVNDLTVMVFFQLAHGEIRVIDYYEDSNKGVDFYAKFLLQDKKYLYHTIFLPHDSTKRDALDVSNTYERDFKRLFEGTGTKFHVIKRMDKQLQIGHAKIMLARCVFNISKVKKYLDQVSKYRKRWNEATSRYLEEPLHNVCCFVADTLIETDKGLIRIDQIKIGDMVSTPSGNKKVLNVIRNKTKKLVHISNAESSILCTPHHKVFTSKGLVMADSLRYNDHIITKGDAEIWKTISYHGLEKGLGFKDYFLSMSREQLSNLMAEATRKTNSVIGWETVVHYKEMFGYFIKEIFPINMISTISMRINQIIQLKISNLFPIPITCVCTCLQRNEKNYLENILEKPLKHQKHGTEVKKALNGIATMERNVSKRKRFWINVATIAKKVFKQFSRLLNIVPQHVNQILEENQEKTMKKEPAKCVLRSLPVTDMKQKKPVLKVVELCLAIEREVYDLTVESDHCYFANGFLVSNSNYADCHQYMSQAVAHLETVSNMGGAYEKHKKAVANRANRI